MSFEEPFNEKYLVEELKNSNEKAFKLLFDFYRNDLYGYCLSILHSKEYAEEIVQEVFMKIWVKRFSLNPEMSFKSYLFTITRNKSIKFLKKAANNKKLREEIFYKSQKFSKPADINLREKELELLKNKALDKLSPRRRLIFEMSRNENKTYEDIAKELGISINTVRNQMSKSLETLRIVIFENRDSILLLSLFTSGWL